MGNPAGLALPHAVERPVDDPEDVLPKNNPFGQLNPPVRQPLPIPVGLSHPAEFAAPRELKSLPDISHTTLTPVEPFWKQGIAPEAIPRDARFRRVRHRGRQLLGKRLRRRFARQAGGRLRRAWRRLGQSRRAESAVSRTVFGRFPRPARSGLRRSRTAPGHTVRAAQRLFRPVQRDPPRTANQQPLHPRRGPLANRLSRMGPLRPRPSLGATITPTSKATGGIRTTRTC